MTIGFQVLGHPGRDNALYVTVDTGQAMHRLLFDCGQGVLDSFSISDVQQIVGLFFSHFHFDHVAGFDSFFRLNWCRPEVPVRIFGPGGTRQIIHHRLQGVTWNLVAGLPGEVRVSELDGETLRTSAFLTQEGFAVDHDRGEQAFSGVIYSGNGFNVFACPLNHGTVSLGYVVREYPRQNIDPVRLTELGLQPGPWLRAVRDANVADDQPIDAGDEIFLAGDLRGKLTVTNPGRSIAYLTDFLLESPEAEDRLVQMLNGCETLVCENSYADADAELARRNYHLTSSDVARLANRVQPERLVLFHLSDRYTADGWREQLQEVRQLFPRVSFPDTWSIENSISGGSG